MLTEWLQRRASGFAPGDRGSCGAAFVHHLDTNSVGKKDGGAGHEGQSRSSQDMCGMGVWHGRFDLPAGAQPFLGHRRVDWRGLARSTGLTRPDRFIKRPFVRDLVKNREAGRPGWEP